MAINEQDFSLGVFAFLKGDYEKASDYLLLATLNPVTKAEALNALGLVSLQQGRRSDAKDYFCSALQVSPSFTAANFNLFEGMEMDVLRGATATLLKSRPVILVEMIKTERSRIERFLSQFGYEFFPIGMNLLC